MYLFIIGILKKKIKKKGTEDTYIYVTCVRNKAQAEEVYHSAHIQDTSHSGITRTIDRIGQHWYWKGFADYARQKVHSVDFKFLTFINLTFKFHKYSYFCTISDKPNTACEKFGLTYFKEVNGNKEMVNGIRKLMFLIVYLKSSSSCYFHLFMCCHLWWRKCVKRQDRCKWLNLKFFFKKLIVLQMMFYAGQMNLMWSWNSLESW